MVSFGVLKAVYSTFDYSHIRLWVFQRQKQSGSVSRTTRSNLSISKGNLIIMKLTVLLRNHYLQIQQRVRGHLKTIAIRVRFQLQCI